MLPGFDAPPDAGVRSTSTTVPTGEPMTNPFQVASDHDAGSPDGNADHPRASVMDANVAPVPKPLPGDELAAFRWLQQQQAWFAARFLSPSFREG